jgi:predicted enzyme related to lactoylglutathione lyase
MLTPAPAGARSFFGKLLDWTFANTGMGYTVQVDGQSVGAIFDLDDPNTPRGTPPLVGLMFKVESADTAGNRVRKLGGQAGPAFDIGAAGRMSVCHDPNGAEFDVWQPGSLAGTEIDSDATGAPTWFETMTSDVDRAAAFYSGLFGWRATAAGEAGDRTFELDGRPIAAAKPRAPDGPSPHWAIYFAVTDADATARRARELGGEVFGSVRRAKSPRTDGIRSPQGVPFHVMQRG